MGAATVGKYSRAPPLYLGRSSGLGRPSAPAKSVTASARSWRPLPDPPPETLIVTADWSVLNDLATSSRKGFWNVDPDSLSVAAPSGADLAVVSDDALPDFLSLPQAPATSAVASTAAVRCLAALSRGWLPIIIGHAPLTSTAAT